MRESLTSPAKIAAVMADGLNVVPVLRVHLEEIEQTLANCEGLLTSLDLQQEYRNMGKLVRPSRLTQDVQRKLERVQGYLLTDEAEEDERVQ